MPDTTDKTPGRALVTQRHRTITESTAAFLGIDAAKVFDLLRGVWTVTNGKPPLSNQELMVGMALVSRYGLDPFAREIYVTRDNKGKLMVVVGVDGWIRVLNRTPGYDGFEQELVLGEGGEIKEVITRIYSKDRSHPATYRAFASDYAKLGGFMIGKIPGHMLRIFSLKHAARLFTPLGCVVTQEEAEWMTAAPPEPINSLEQLTERLTAEPEPEPEPEPERTPVDAAPTPRQTTNADELAERIGNAITASNVAQLEGDLERCLRDGFIARRDHAALVELLDGAKAKLSKV